MNYYRKKEENWVTKNATTSNGLGVGVWGAGPPQDRLQKKKGAHTKTTKSNGLVGAWGAAATQDILQTNRELGIGWAEAGVGGWVRCVVN